MYYQSCGVENPEGLKFCRECGHPLRVRRARSDCPNQPQVRFWSASGTPLTAQNPAPPAAHSHAPVWYTPSYLAEKGPTSESAIKGSASR
jgi:hypothetical protein